MKKHLIAAAVAAAVVAPAAMAQTVTMTGALEAGYTSKDVRAFGSTTTNTKQSAITSGHVITPNITFSGTEDLGGGLKASFMMQEEYNIATGDEDVTNSVGSLSQALVSLSGGFGAISVGKMNHATRDLGGVYRFFGDIGRLAGAMNSVNNVNNTVQYVSPTFSGFRLSVAQGDVDKTVTSSVDTNVDPQSLRTFGISGNIDKLRLAISQEELKWVAASAGAAQAKTKLLSIGGSYDFGVARLGLVYADQDHTLASGANGGERKAMGIHAAAPVTGAITLGASFTNYEVTLAAGGAKPEADVLTLAAQYALSKRTSIYASYQSVKNSGAADALASVSAAGINSGAVGSSRGLGVVETTGTTADGFGLTLVHSF